MADMFANAGHVSYGGSVTEKQAALALDYLTKGKTMQWVLDNVCGDDGKAVAKTLTVAVEHRFISAEQKRQTLSHYRIDANGRKVR